MVSFSSRLISASSCRTEAVVCGSRALVASSHSRIFGLVARARAMPTRCFWPPDSCAGYFLGVVGQTDPRQQFGHALIDLAARQLAGQGQRQRDVVGNGLGGQQVEVLEDHPDLLAETAQAVGVQRGDFFAVDDDLAAAGVFQAIDQAQQGTFPAPEWPIRPKT
jgi:hypothetical protein